jgi:tetratricopeptide (TPR) repeat protein
MRIFAAFICASIAASASCSAQEPSHYIRNKPGVDSPVIVFVHGVLGDSNGTWKNAKTKTNWPELLMQDDTFKSASIFVHEYNTEMFRRGSLSIGELAKQLKQVLDGHDVTQHTSLIFVAHSMGGLVVREFLIQDREAASKTSFIFLLATPTTGATIANWAKLVSNTNPQFKQMTKVKDADPSFLTTLRDHWIAAGFERTLITYCAYEKVPMYGVSLISVSLIVDQTSATSLCNTGVMAIQADHSEIAKPEGPTADQYLALKNAFKQQGVVKQDTVITKQTLVDSTYKYLDDGEWDRVIKDLSEVIQQDYQYVPALKNRGAAYMGKAATHSRKSDYVRAIADYIDSIDLEPAYAEHFYNRGASYFGILDYDRAIEDFTKAASLDFYDSALTLYARGIAKQCKGDPRGKADIEEASRIEPNVVKSSRAQFFACSTNK